MINFPKKYFFYHLSKNPASAISKYSHVHASPEVSENKGYRTESRIFKISYIVTRKVGDLVEVLLILKRSLVMISPTTQAKETPSRYLPFYVHPLKLALIISLQSLTTLTYNVKHRGTFDGDRL